MLVWTSMLSKLELKLKAIHWGLRHNRTKPSIQWSEGWHEKEKKVLLHKSSSRSSAWFVGCWVFGIWCKLNLFALTIALQIYLGIMWHRLTSWTFSNTVNIWIYSGLWCPEFVVSGWVCGPVVCLELGTHLLSQHPQIKTASHTSVGAVRANIRDMLLPLRSHLCGLPAWAWRSVWMG